MLAAHQASFIVYFSEMYDFSKSRGSNRLGLQKTPTVSLQRVKTPLTSVLDITLNNLMVRLQ